MKLPDTRELRNRAGNWHGRWDRLIAEGPNRNAWLQWKLNGRLRKIPSRRFCLATRQILWRERGRHESRAAHRPVRRDGDSGARCDIYNECDKAHGVEPISGLAAFVVGCEISVAAARENDHRRCRTVSRRCSVQGDRWP